MDLAPIPSRALLGLAALLAAAGCHRGNDDIHPAVAAPLPGAAAPPPARGRQLTLIYAANQLASYETCGCAVQPMGGLARRATQIDRARTEADAVLVLDAGDLFTPAPAPGAAPPTPREVERRAQLLADAHKRMGTTALVPGERDVALGLPLLRRMATRAGLPLVAANLVGRDGKPPFEADRIVETKGGDGATTVGIFGLTAPPGPAEAAAWQRAGLEVRDPVAAARETVRSLRARGAQLVIALLHLPTEAESRKLLAAVPGIDWAVLGHVGSRYETAQPIGAAGTTRLLGVMPEGKELGRADLHVVQGGLTFVDRGARAELEAILADHRRQLGAYDQPLGHVDQASLRDYHDARRKQIGEAIAREQEALARMPATIAGSWFENRLIPLDAETPDQVGVAVLVDAYKHENARRPAAGKPVEAGAVTTAGYTGSPACGGCHAPALAFWQGTKHAGAFSALVRAGHGHDPSCVGCHVTGYGQPGGPADLAAATRVARFANVGCESCHGPGRAHAEAKARQGRPGAAAEPAPLSPAGEATCRGCHTADRTNGDFDYARMAAAILGPGHGKPANAKPGLAPGPKAPL